MDNKVLSEKRLIGTVLRQSSLGVRTMSCYDCKRAFLKFIFLLICNFLRTLKLDIKNSKLSATASCCAFNLVFVFEPSGRATLSFSTSSTFNQDSYVPLFFLVTKSSLLAACRILISNISRAVFLSSNYFL